MQAQIPIIKKGRDIPLEAKVDEECFQLKPTKERCLNYSPEQIELAMAPFDDGVGGSEAPAGMSQFSQLSQGDDDDDVVQIFDEEFFGDAILTTDKERAKKQSGHSLTIQAHKEFCSKFLDGNPDRIQTFLDDMAARSRQYRKEDNPYGDQAPKGTVTSSELQSSKKRKAHGSGRCGSK